MKQLDRAFLLHLFLGMLIAACVTTSASASNTVGESSGDVWVGGPADLKLGNNPTYSHAAVDQRGRSIYVWEETTPITRRDVPLRIFDADGALFKIR